MPKSSTPKPWPCKYCVIQCHNLCEVKGGPYAYKGKGPEYESFAMVGFNTMVDDVKAVAYACELANLYSMDTISLGVVIAWAMECYEKEVITQKDTYGLDLKWGNAEAMVEMVKKIGERADGLGYLLGEGCKIASEQLGKGSENWAVQMKGQEIAAHNWRAQYISALNYCTGVASGPNHERGNSQHIWVGHIRLPEWGIGEVENEERWSWDKAGDRNAKFHDYCNVINSACHCKFMEFRGLYLDRSLQQHQRGHRLGLEPGRPSPLRRTDYDPPEDLEHPLWLEEGARLPVPEAFHGTGGFRSGGG